MFRSLLMHCMFSIVMCSYIISTATFALGGYAGNFTNRMEAYKLLSQLCNEHSVNCVAMLPTRIPRSAGIRNIPLELFIERVRTQWNVEAVYWRKLLIMTPNQVADIIKRVSTALTKDTVARLLRDWDDGNSVDIPGYDSVLKAIAALSKRQWDESIWRAAEWMAAPELRKIIFVHENVQNSWVRLVKVRATVDDPCTEHLQLVFPKLSSTDSIPSVMATLHSPEFDPAAISLARQKGIIPLAEYKRRIINTAKANEKLTVMPLELTRLMSDVTFERSIVSLSDLVERLNAKTDIRLSVHESLSSRKIFVALNAVPIGDVLTAIARCVHSVWVKKGDGYELTPPMLTIERIWCVLPLDVWKYVALTHPERDLAQHRLVSELWNAISGKLHKTLMRRAMPARLLPLQIRKIVYNLAILHEAKMWERWFRNLPERDSPVPLWLFESPAYARYELAAPGYSEEIQGYAYIRLKASLGKRDYVLFKNLLNGQRASVVSAKAGMPKRRFKIALPYRQIASEAEWHRYKALGERIRIEMPDTTLIEALNAIHAKYGVNYACLSPPSVRKKITLTGDCLSDIRDQLAKQFNVNATGTNLLWLLSGEAHVSGNLEKVIADKLAELKLEQSMNEREIEIVSKFIKRLEGDLLKRAKPVNDFAIATVALPEEVAKVFRHCALIHDMETYRFSLREPIMLEKRIVLCVRNGMLCFKIPGRREISNVSLWGGLSKLVMPSEPLDIAPWMPKGVSHHLLPLMENSGEFEFDGTLASFSQQFARQFAISLKMEPAVRNKHIVVKLKLPCWAVLHCIRVLTGMLFPINNAQTFELRRREDLKSIAYAEAPISDRFVMLPRSLLPNLGVAFQVALSDNERKAIEYEGLKVGELSRHSWNWWKLISLALRANIRWGSLEGLEAWMNGKLYCIAVWNADGLKELHVSTPGGYCYNVLPVFLKGKHVKAQVDPLWKLRIGAQLRSRWTALRYGTRNEPNWMNRSGAGGSVPYRLISTPMKRR